MNLKKYFKFTINFLVIVLFVYLILFSTSGTFDVIYSISSVILILQIFLSKSTLKMKVLMGTIYLVIMITQLIVNDSMIFSGVEEGLFFTFKKFIAVLLISASLLISYIKYLYDINNQCFPIFSDISTISFELLGKVSRYIGDLKSTVKKSKKVLNKDNLNEIIKDIPRHSYTKYLNRGNLTDAFFEECEHSLKDENIYIVLSSTGSPASEFLSVFTQKTFNHVSLSLDYDLKTILSYNGGENVYPPGLNKEYIMFFNQKKDASMLIYSLKVAKDKKRTIIDKIKEINKSGSAYNLLGLVTKFSIKPNIMFCSQFVYSMLKMADLNYFLAKPTGVKPTDFVERDYHRNLSFCYEVNFSDLDDCFFR